MNQNQNPYQYLQTSKSVLNKQKQSNASAIFLARDSINSSMGSEL